MNSLHPFIIHEIAELDGLAAQISSGREKPDVIDSGKRTPLIRAAIVGEEKVIAKLLLLKPKPNVNAQDFMLRSALHYAVQEYSISIASLLIKSGANVNLQDKYGNSSLHFAVSHSLGRGELITLLRMNGANPELPNKAGITPLNAATRAGAEIEQFFKWPLR